MSPEFWAIVGSGLLVAYGVHRAAERIVDKLQEVNERLYDVETLVGRIPGVEDYQGPDLAEWSEQRQKNPDANKTNRRNWAR